MRQLNLFGEPVKENIRNEEIIHTAKSYTGLYALHKYWGKKPFNIMADFIKKYSNQNDIVLDPFLGSGVSLTEAVFNNRKGFGIDINPSATFITKQIIKKIDPYKLISEFKSIENDLKGKINSYYTVIRDENTFVGQNFLWDKGELIEIRYQNGGRKRVVTTPEISDIKLSESVTLNEIETFYPKSNFFHNSRINAKRDNKIHELFTNRNLKALSLLYDRIEKISDIPLQNIFKFCFTSAIGQASKMVFVIKRRNKTKLNASSPISDKKEIGSWVIGYWMPKEYFENNVWTTYETRFKKLLKAKKEQYSIYDEYISSNNFKELKANGDYLIVNEPSQDYLKKIPDNSIDYILTDPPHGNRIPYLELSLLWNSWLKKDVNYQDEIIVSESKDRTKNKDDYNLLLNEVIKECYRVLKNGKYLSFMFNSLDDKAWLNIVKIFYEVGFQLEAIETLGYSANSVVQDNRKNGLQTDFIITYKKDYKTNNLMRIIDNNELQNFMPQIIKLKKKGLKTFQIMNNILTNLLSNNQFVKISELIKRIENAE